MREDAPTTGPSSEEFGRANLRSDQRNDICGRQQWDEIDALPCPVRNSQTGEWMLFESSSCQSPSMVTMCHGNFHLTAKKQDWHVVLRETMPVQMLGVGEWLQFVPMQTNAPPMPAIPAMPTGFGEMLAKTMNQLAMESEQRTLAIRAEMEMRLQELKQQQEADKNFNNETRDMAYRNVSGVKRLAEGGDNGAASGLANSTAQVRGVLRELQHADHQLGLQPCPYTSDVV